MENVFVLVMGIGSLIIAGLSVFLAIFLSVRTDKLIKSEDERAKGMIEQGKKETQQMIGESQKMIEEGRRETRELLAKMDESTKELLMRMDERTLKIAEMIERISRRPVTVEERPSEYKKEEK